MSKYIDADRLSAEMEKRMHICDGVFERNSDTYYQGKAVAYQETLSFVNSLQQEEEWEGQRTWIEQTSEDLKGEIREWVNLMVGASFPEQDGDYISEEDYRSVIRQTSLHFYELGKKNK